MLSILVFIQTVLSAWSWAAVMIAAVFFFVESDVIHSHDIESEISEIEQGNFPWTLLHFQFSSFWCSLFSSYSFPLLFLSRSLHFLQPLSDVYTYSQSPLHSLNTQYLKEVSPLVPVVLFRYKHALGCRHPLLVKVFLVFTSILRRSLCVQSTTHALYLTTSSVHWLIPVATCLIWNTDFETVCTQRKCTSIFFFMTAALIRLSRITPRCLHLSSSTCFTWYRQCQFHCNFIFNSNLISISSNFIPISLKMIWTVWTKDCSSHSDLP